MFLLCDLRFVLCSLDFDVLRAQRIMAFFILITHKSMRSENLITWNNLHLFKYCKLFTKTFSSYLML